MSATPDIISSSTTRPAVAYNQTKTVAVRTSEARDEALVDVQRDPADVAKVVQYPEAAFQFVQQKHTRLSFGKLINCQQQCRHA